MARWTRSARRPRTARPGAGSSRCTARRVCSYRNTRPAPTGAGRGVFRRGASDAVFGRGLVLQPVVEPAADVLLVLHAPRRRPAARQLMMLAGESLHDGGLSLLLQPAVHDLALRDRGAP